MPKAKDAELVPTEKSELMQRPDFVSSEDVRGTEDISREDIQMPRLALAQQMSPELNPDDGSHIENLKVGDMFNNLTRQVYGRGPIEFCVVRADPPRFVEFFPREQGGGVKDPNVPPDDPRAQFGPNGEKPAATKFYDFVVMLLPSREPVVMSFKSTGIKAARQLNGLIKMRKAPIFAGRYVIQTAMTKNAKGTFAVYQVRNFGWVDKETYGFAEALFEALQDKTIVVEREDSPDEGGDASFDTNDLDMTPGSRQAEAGQQG